MKWLCPECETMHKPDEPCPPAMTQETLVERALASRNESCGNYQHPHLIHELATELTRLQAELDEAVRINDLANALLTRGDFWAEINDCGVVLPGEVDDLTDAFISKHGESE